jgi:hypothetical protein
MPDGHVFGHVRLAHYLTFVYVRFRFTLDF